MEPDSSPNYSWGEKEPRDGIRNLDREFGEVDDPLLRGVNIYYATLNREDELLDRLQYTDDDLLVDRTIDDIIWLNRQLGYRFDELVDKVTEETGDPTELAALIAGLVMATDSIQTTAVDRLAKRTQTTLYDFDTLRNMIESSYDSSDTESFKESIKKEYAQLNEAAINEVKWLYDYDQ